MAKLSRAQSTTALQSALEMERQRALDRRSRMRVERPPGHEQAQWALALSGGGIRSATFCLGVLQGLSRRPGPLAATKPLLHQFDYVSTVSGGGYIGGFLSSLYVPGRLSGVPGEEETSVAERAAQVLNEDPPSRMHHDTVYDSDRPGKAALAWLRDNGRYMAPSGAGDYLYAVGLAIRNWFAMQYVVGTAICLVFALIALVRWAVLFWCPFMAQQEQSLLDAARCSSGIWWSTLWWFCLPVLLLWTLPAGVGFWFSHAENGLQLSDPPRPLTRAGLFSGLLGLVFLALALWAPDQRHVGLTPTWIVGVGVFLVVTVALLWHFASYARACKESVVKQRVLLTRWLTAGLIALLLVAAIAAIETVSQTVQLNFAHWVALTTSSSVVAAFVWVARALVEAQNEKKPPAWLARMPVDTLSTAAGLVLWLLIAIAWHLLVQTLIWDRFSPETTGFSAQADLMLSRAAVVALVCVVMALIVGQFPGFLNLSTLQGLYSARLTRAYLGASNHRRFKPSGSPAAHSAAEPIDGDGMTVEDLYRNQLAPMHLINVCVNQTVDPAEQLVQRDRKGKPMVVTPSGFHFDGTAYPFRSPANVSDGSELASPLGLGEWIGVSGAAFTTGLGRATSLGMSLLLGFANVRLGRWWPAKFANAQRTWGLRRFFKTQVYLFDELSAKFYGARREYQYLSDGGHFENTATYELLRAGREIKLIVVCDCGCDPDYGFEDMANLMRLARIDHRLELRVNEAAADHAQLGSVFGRPCDLGQTTPCASTEGRCALLIDIARPEGDGQPEATVARMIVLKPRLIAGTPLDLANYQRLHPAFPQEPTGDQFYDEGQWESYRKLGLVLAQRVFPQDSNSPYGVAFWEHVLVAQ